MEAVGKLTKPMMAEILAMYGKSVQVQTAKDDLQLDCIIVLNASGVLKTVQWYEDKERLRLKVRRR